MSRAASYRLLLIAGLLLVAVGLGVLIDPLAVAGSSPTLGSETNLMSELRGPGGLLLACGILIVIGAVRSTHTQLALTLSALAFGGFGLSRLVSLLLDGIPSGAVLAAMALELLIGGLSVIALLSRDGDGARRPVGVGR
ncbi:MAG: DUF4345 domain-containing protein [Pseudomonadota bacterium]